MHSDEVVPNISQFLFGGKTAVYEEDKRTGRYIVTFRVQYTKSFKISAASKSMATGLGRNRIRRSLKQLSKRHKMRVEKISVARMGII